MAAHAACAEEALQALKQLDETKLGIQEVLKRARQALQEVRKRRAGYPAPMSLQEQDYWQATPTEAEVRALQMQPGTTDEDVKLTVGILKCQRRRLEEVDASTQDVLHTLCVQTVALEQLAGALRPMAGQTLKAPSCKKGRR